MTDMNSKTITLKCGVEITVEKNGFGPVSIKELLNARVFMSGCEAWHLREGQLALNTMLAVWVGFVRLPVSISCFLFFLERGAMDFFLLIINELQNTFKISENKFGGMKLWYYLWRIN